MLPSAPPPPRACLALGVTGHRAFHPLYANNTARIEAALEDLLDIIEAAVAATPSPFGADWKAPTRLHSMLADGVDQRAARSALTRGWELVAPLPFGRALNVAINAAPESTDDAYALLAGSDAANAVVQERAEAIRTFHDKARLFELADRDDAIEAQLLAKLKAPAELAKAQAFLAASSERVALAARVLIEQSDIIVAVWDGDSSSFIGGTGHTIAAALHTGAPVVWIDIALPEAWRILRAPESLAARPSPLSPEGRATALTALVHAALASEHVGTKHAASLASGPHVLAAERWRPHSTRLWHTYRRIEALFEGEKGRWPLRSLLTRYESPDAVSSGSGAGILAAARTLPGADPTFGEALEQRILRRFAWADGVSSHLADVYRGSMSANFLLAALAVVVGIAYLPFASADDKAYFAGGEFALLATILTITMLGQRRRWHGRWFETRRVAEYFRHAPLLLTLGVARAPGRWPRGTETSWPEWYARHALREIGLPRIAVTRAYLHEALTLLLDEHIVRQRDYHRIKAKRLSAVHHNLDRFSVFLFSLAVGTVALFLVLMGVTQVWTTPHDVVYPATKTFTFLGVLLPTFGAAIAGIRYFADFERFAAISEVTAQKLDAAHARVTLLSSAGEAGTDYALLSDLVHVADDIVVAEIESWQAVFGGKHITVPV